MRLIPKSNQAFGAFNGGQIIENKPIGFPQDRGFVRPYANLFYWARAEAMIDSTIGLHPHQGFEIMSFVLEGNIRHFDTKLNNWKPLEKGDVQIIRAGNGISHSEHMEKGAVIFQIWMDPDLGRTLQKPASYDDYKGSQFLTERTGDIETTYYVGPNGKINMDSAGVDIRKVKIDSGNWTMNEDKEAVWSVYILSGSGMLNGKTVETDDFIIIEDGEAIDLKADKQGVEIFFIRNPKEPGYPLYIDRLKERN